MRRALVKVHLWLGLIVGLFWAVQGLTGALLVFHREAERWTMSAFAAGPMRSVDELIVAAEGRANAPILRIGIVDAHPDLLAAEYDDATGHPRAILISAATGQVIAVRDREPAMPIGASRWRWVYLLHESLLSGDIGETVVGASGLLLLFTLGTGLWVAWPRRRAWRAVVAASRWRTRGQQLYGWHRAVGLTAALAMLLILPGGIYMIFSKSIRESVAAVAPHELPYQPSAANDCSAPAISAQQALAAALMRFPDAGFVRLGLPTAKAPVYAVRLHQPGEIRAWSGTTTVMIDAGSGGVLHVYDAMRAPLSNRVLDALFSIHNGEIAGFLGRLAVMAAGLALPALYILGVWAWLSRKRRKWRVALRR